MLSKAQLISTICEPSTPPPDMALREVTMLFEDGRTFRIRAQEEETLYVAALRQSIRLETDCLEGVCAACKAQCSVGEYVIRDYSEDALSVDDVQNRYILACQTSVRSDCVVEFPYDSTRVSKDVAPAEQVGQIVEVQRLTPSVIRLEVNLGANQFAFLPGQYAYLRLPGTDVSRAYSFANIPGSRSSYSFYVKLCPGGAMSEFLASHAAVGDSLTLIGPYGRFYIRPPKRPILMLAGGTGLAPMLSMLGHLQAEKTPDIAIHLIYGASHSDDLFGVSQLEAYASNGLNFSYECVAGKSSAQWKGKQGFVTDCLRPELIHGGNCDAYICGPPAMIEAGTSWLRSAGLSAARVHAEKFLPFKQCNQ